MNSDEQQVDSTVTESQETTTETVVNAEAAVAASADPLDAIEDIDELRKIAKANRSAANRYKKDAKQTKPQLNKEESVTLRPSDILKSEEFKLHREGYDEDEIELIVRNGGRKILEDKNNPINLGLQARREQRATERAASQTSNSTGQSEVERKYTREQLLAMSSDELAKILPHA